MLYAIGRLRLLPRPMSTWAATLTLFAAYVLIAGAMLLYAEHFVSARVDADLYPLPWLADGVAVSLMLLWGKRTWPAVFLGSVFIWGVMRGDPAVLVVVDALGETASVLITVQLLRSLHFRRQLDRLADPLILVAAALIGRAIAGLADVGGTLLGAWLTPQSLSPGFLAAATRPGTLIPAITWDLVFAMARWQLNAIAGIVLAVPLLLASPRKLRHALRLYPLRLATLGLLSLLWMVAALELSAIWTGWPLLLAALMLVAWAAIEFSALTAGLCTLLFACTAAAAFCQGVGPLASTDVVEALSATWGFIGLLCCASPVLTVLLTVRQHYDRRLGILAERYRSLFTANPTPAWVADAQTGAILMANAEAVRRYRYSEPEFLSMKISELCPEPPSAADPAPPDGELVAAPLSKHVTSDGRVIDVEMVSTPLELDGRPVNLLYAVDLTDHQELRRRLLATVDRESFRVSQELHDGLAQVLAGLAVGSEALLQSSERGRFFDAAGVAQLRELTQFAQQAESHLFQLTSGVSPSPQAEPSAGTASAERRTERAPRPAGSAAHPPTSLTRYLATAALIVLACWIGGVISHTVAVAHSATFNYADPRLAVPSLLAGATVCGLWLGGARQWPAVLVGVVLVRVDMMREPVGTALVLGAVTVMGCQVGVAVLRRWNFTASLDRWQDPLVLCAAMALSWSLVNVLGLAALIMLAAAGARLAPGVAALYASSGLRMSGALLDAEIRWWFDAVAGTVLLVPTLTLPSALQRAVKENLAELSAWCTCLAGWALLLLTVNTDKLLLPLLTLSILLVVWAAARLGVAFASLATLTFAMVAATSFSTHTGLLATQHATTGVAYVWGIVSVHTVIGLFLAALLAEHHSRHREITAVSKRYRSLFQGDPRPLWLHDARTGRILDANEPAARVYGYSMAEFTGLRVEQLLAPGTSPDALSGALESAVGPVTMRHRRKAGDTMDMEMWSYATFLDGRRVHICFAHDVTERNTLRRLLFDRAELERRQLASELRGVLAGPLAELRIVAHKLLLEFGRQAAHGRMRELLESLARQAQRAAERCREAAHQLSPLQANGGDLVAALHALQRQTPAAAPLKISVDGAAPFVLGQQQLEHVYGLLSELVKRCPAGRPGDTIQVAITNFGHIVRLSLDAELPDSNTAPTLSLARHPSVLLRVRAMGARLWELSRSGPRTRVVCDCPL
jgi:PAS domain S-box-containing protein